MGLWGRRKWTNPKSRGRRNEATSWDGKKNDNDDDDDDDDDNDDGDVDDDDDDDRHHHHHDSLGSIVGNNDGAGVRVICAYGHPHSHKPSDMNIRCNPNPNR